jgi:thiol:disulfide interchange protein DsbD
MDMRKASLLIYFSILISVFLSINFAYAAKPLPADQAFKLSVEVKSANEIVTHWRIAPSYLLYKDKFKFSVTPADAVSASLPAGIFKKTIKHGLEEMYVGSLDIPVSFKANAQSLQLKISYQGCSENGFCYPPMQQVMTVNLETHAFKNLLTNQNNVQLLLTMSNTGLILLVFMGIGMLLAFTPCILPVIPILAGVIIDTRHPVSTKRAFWLSFAYVIGMALAYAVAGLLAAWMGQSLQVWLQNPWVIGTVCLLFVLLAFSLFGMFYLHLPRKIQNFIARISHRQQGGTYLGAFSMGVLSTLIVSPCVTAPLIGVLLYIAESGNQLFGASALFAMGIGMGIPLLLFGISAGKWLPKSGPWMEAIKKSFGFVMLAMAIWLLSRVVSQTTVTILWGLLLLALAFFLALYLPLIFKRNVFIRGLGGLSGLMGLFLMLSSFLQQPSASLLLSSEVLVDSITAVNQRIAAANATHRPVMLDFYADWCESCVAMDKLFKQPNIKKALEGFVVLRVDLSSNKPEDAALLKYFNVIAPPAVLFFSDQGKEVNTRRIVGEISADELLSRITLFYAAGCDKKAQC